MRRRGESPGKGGWTRLEKGSPVVLSEIDRHLLDRCLHGKPRAWEDFVDRFLGLVIHVIQHTAQSRSVRLTPDLRDDLAADVFLALLENDFAVLRHFKGKCSLAAYLTVVARRVVVRSLIQRKAQAATLGDAAAQATDGAAGKRTEEDRLMSRDEAERLLSLLESQEAAVVRMYHLEEKSYQEISQATGIPVNSIGPILSRARSKMRRLSPA